MATLTALSAVKAAFLAKTIPIKTKADATTINSPANRASFLPDPIKMSSPAKMARSLADSAKVNPPPTWANPLADPI